MRIYISGRISGLTEAEYTSNFAAAERSMVYNYQANYSNAIFINPLYINPLFGRKKRTKEIITKNGVEYKTHWTELHKEWWLWYMIADIQVLRTCTHIAMQKNWIDSRGACLEYGFAKWIFKQQIIWL